MGGVGGWVYHNGGQSLISIIESHMGKQLNRTV